MPRMYVTTKDTDKTSQVGDVGLLEYLGYKDMNKIKSVLKSRTFWTAVILFLVAGVDGIKDLIPQVLQLPLEGLLTLLVGWFRVNPRQ